MIGVIQSTSCMSKKEFGIADTEKELPYLRKSTKNV